MSRPLRPLARPASARKIGRGQIMQHARQHYVNGAWVDPLQPKLLDVIDPSTEEAFTQIAVGGSADVDRAVAAARAIFPAFAATTRKQRLDLLRAILEAYNKRRQDIASVLSQEVRAPLKFAYERQSATGTGHLTRMIQVLEDDRFEEVQGTTLIAREPKRAQRHDDRAGGDLRPRALDPALSGRGQGDRLGERDGLRAGRLCAVRRSRACAPAMCM
jgi:Aldehyde dehydrogenase family